MKQWPGKGSEQMLLMCLLYIYCDTIYQFSVNLLNNNDNQKKGKYFLLTGANLNLRKRQSASG